MGGNGEPLAHGRIWSGPLKLLLPALPRPLGPGESPFCWGRRIAPAISLTAGPFSKIQTPFDSPVRELPEQGVKFDLEAIEDGTGPVKNVMFDCSGLIRLASKLGIGVGVESV